MAPSPDPRSSLVSGRYIACLNEKEQHKLVIVVSLFGFAIQTVLAEYHQGCPRCHTNPTRHRGLPRVARGTGIRPSRSRFGLLLPLTEPAGWVRCLRFPLGGVRRREFAFFAVVSRFLWPVRMRVAWKRKTENRRTTSRSPRNTPRTLRTLPLLTI